MPLTQQELGDMVGASRPVISSTLNQLRHDGVLDYFREFICINDLPALRKISAISEEVSPS